MMKVKKAEPLSPRWNGNRCRCRFKAPQGCIPFRMDFVHFENAEGARGFCLEDKPCRLG